MLTQLNLRGIQETLPVEDVMTDLDPVEAPGRDGRGSEEAGSRRKLGHSNPPGHSDRAHPLVLQYLRIAIPHPEPGFLRHFLAAPRMALRSRGRGNAGPCVGTGSVLAWTEAEIPDASSSPGWSLRRQRRHRGRVVRGSIITFCRFGEPLHFTPKSDCFWDEHRVSHLSEVTI